MGWLSRRRGVISVFLLIVFMVTFVFVGALVDAGRYRIAQTYAEAALDSATSSVLSHYNQLIYDLYGIFAVDVDASDEDAMKAEIKTAYQRYVDETLGVADLDTSKYGTILSDIVGDLLDGKTQDPDQVLTNLHLNGLYDFSTEDFQVGSVVTLADYTYVENQIIEHMKYRAPVSLVQSADGFFGTIKQIGTLTDTIAAVKEKTELTAKYEEVQESVAGTPDSVANFAVEVNNFFTTYSKANMLNAAAEFDKVFTTAAEDYNQDLIDANKAYLDNLKESSINVLKSNYPREYVLIEYNLEEQLDTVETISDKEDELDGYEVDKADKEYKRENAVAKGNEAEIQRLDRELENIVDDIESCKQAIADYEEYLEGLKKSYEELQPIAGSICNYKNRLIWAHGLGSADELIKIANDINNDNDYRTYKVNLTSIYNQWQLDISNAVAKCLETVAGAKGKAAGYFNTMSTEAETLKKKASDLQATLESDLEKYKTYIDDLEDLGEKQTTVGNVCAVDAQTAKASAGAIVDILPYLQRIQGCLACFCEGIEEEEGKAKVKIAEWVAKREDVIIADCTAYIYSTTMAPDTGFSLKTDLENNQAFKNLCTLRDAASKENSEFMKEYKVDAGETDDSTSNKAKKITDQKLSSKDMEEELAKDEVKKGSKSIDTVLITENPGILDINFTKTKSDTTHLTTTAEVSGKGSFSVINAVVGALGTLVDGLNTLLQNGRDNIYINTYIMDTFPNYFTHYAKADDNKDDKLLTAPLKDYNASLAEVEFILTGAGVGEDEDYASLVADPEGFAKLIQDIKAFFGIEPEDPVGIGELSAKEFRTRLYGIRLLFNTLSILLDASMYTQANAISAWAGPFAPAVAVVVMIAWVLAETVIDVKVLTASKLGELDLDTDGDGKVLLLKTKSSQWHISVKGALEQITNAAIGAVMDQLSLGVDQVAESVRGQADALMFDIYMESKDKANATLDSVLESDAVKGTKENLLGWGEAFKSNVTAVADDTNMKVVTDAAEGVNKAIDDTMSKASDYVEKAETDARKSMDQFIDDTYKKTSTKVLEGYDKISDEITSAAKSAINAGGEKMKDLVKNNKDKILPNSVVDKEPEGVFAIKMGYSDYLQFFLFLMNGEVKMKRVMALMQANLTNAKNLDYTTGNQDKVNKVLLEYYPASVWADMELSMKFMFMTDQLVPKEWREDGRMKLKVISSQGY